MVNTINFPLLEPVKIIPIHGKAHVAVCTDGDVAITKVGQSLHHKPKYVELTNTGRAKMKRTPAGQYQIVEIRLPMEEAIDEVFYEELDHLLTMYHLMYG